MTEKVVRFACPYCYQDSDSPGTLEEFGGPGALKAHLETAHPSQAPATPVWGREIYPPPEGIGFIESDDIKCVGCGLCAEACSMRHFGVLNKDFARIYVRKFLLPMPKAIVATCAQCQAEERPCEKACPVTPPAIHFDEKTLHMVIDKDTCTGCLLCREACGTEAIHYNPDASEMPFVCDLCDIDNTGERDPRCVKICPTSAIYYHNRDERGRPLRDTFRRSCGEKAEMLAKRLYPLTRDSIAYPPLHP
jgi:Fe-S-cluster-containing hydrogenase component 2